ncbi:MAG: BamA/TamA family outer membrane protein [Candidatus Binataceae bacterium]
MRRVIATKYLLALVCSIILLAGGSARAAFSLTAPSTWGLPANFSATSPSTWPFIPVPEIATDPNSGTTVGLLVAVLGTDQKHQITSIFAPDFNVNTTLGPGSTWRYFSYPSDDTQWFAVVGGSEKIASHVEFDYGTGLTHSKWWSGEVHFLFERDPTERFFGVGNNSSFNNQTNYTTERIYTELLFGINLAEHLQIAFNMRPQWLRIQHGAFGSIPSLGTLFPHVKGINGGSELLNRLFLTYDSRDSISIPTRGTFVSLFAGAADRAFLSSNSFTLWGFELRHYFHISDRIILASHVYTRYVPAGDETPFWEMSWLGGDGGGETSQSSLPLSNQVTWRGYGAGRYIDNNVVAGSLELRTRVWETDIFNTHGILELAPFVDLGQVFHSADSNPLRLDAFHPAGGLGFRGIAMPFVVGFVDFGFGGDGLAVFSGVNYPF